jgi:hypothetical protein
MSISSALTAPHQPVSHPAPLPCFSPNNRGKTLLRSCAACKISAKSKDYPARSRRCEAANREAKRPEQRGQKRQQGSNRVDRAGSEHAARSPFIGGHEPQNTLRIWQLYRRAEALTWNPRMRAASDLSPQAGRGNSRHGEHSLDQTLSAGRPPECAVLAAGCPRKVRASEWSAAPNSTRVLRRLPARFR